MNENEKGLDEAGGKEKRTSKSKIDSSRNSHLQQNCAEDKEASKNGKKKATRRRKGASKPRRIQPIGSKPKLDSRKVNSLDTVLKRVLKAKQSEKALSLNHTSANKNSKMMEIHETLAVHPHMPKAVVPTSSPPGSVESPNSLYSSERTEESVNETVTPSNREPFVKVRPQSSGDISPGLAPSHEDLQRSFSSDAALRKSPIHGYSKEASEVAESGRPSPPSLSSNIPAGLAAMAASMGFPTLMPPRGMVPGSIPSLIAMQQYHRRESFQEDEKKRYDSSPKSQKDSFPANGHRLSSIHNRVPLANSNASPPPTVDMRAQYKRPPHTYPALIASAILDSPGNLITLRGIYDYIMNNFPYYKYCHDKSAWQNSIRHNLSLNQCFVKVPRYENAAKSNYWTMTREGFEEFGNENSFKRRRRRGASLAPISAYKAKKCQNEGGKNVKAKMEPRTPPSGLGSIPNSAAGIGAFPPHLMSFAAGGVWPHGFHGEEMNIKSRKRSHSPSGNETIKQPRMVVLKQGDGPVLDGIKGDDQKRPNSLSSVEEMQGTLNYFSKSIPGKIESQILTSTAQPWIAAAQKIGAQTPFIKGERVATSPNKGATENAFTDGEPVILDGTEIGRVLAQGYGASDVSVKQYQCRFCSYTYIGAATFMLEQHVRIMHPYDLTNLNAKVQEKLPKSPKDSDQIMSLPNMLTSRNSMLAAAAQSNAQNLLAAAQQASAVGNSSNGYPYSASFSTALLNDSVMRSIAEQVNANQAKVVSSDLSSGANNMEAFVQRQHALQQAAAATTSQDQLRLLYQQLAMNNPFLANSGSVFPRQMASTDADSNPFAQQLLQYQQKIINQMKALSDKKNESISSPTRRNSNPDEALESASSPQRSPKSNLEAESEMRKSIHGWKQCLQCDFTAKGEHGLELHYRKAHGRLTSSNEDVTRDTSTVAAEGKMPMIESETLISKFPASASSKEIMTSPAASRSNSPSKQKRSSTPLDLSGAKDDQEDSTRKAGNISSTSTQTPVQQGSDLAENRTCRFCDITFGDEMMHALHMSCHDKTDPFKCTICGQTCNEKYYFNVHLLRGLHQQEARGTPVSIISRQSSIEAARSEGEVSPRRHSDSGDPSANRGRASSVTNEVVY